MMKKELIYIFLFLPQWLVAQHVVNLTVMQPPEFGFSVSKQDTTILKGNSVVLGTDLVAYGGSGEYNYRWSPVTAISNSVILNPVASPTDTTTYILTVTDKNGCSFSVYYCVNVKPQVVKSDLIFGKQNLHAVVFPNPSKGDFKVNLSGIPSRKVEMAIIDNAGKVLKRLNIRNFTGEHTEMLHMNLVSGIYHLRTKSELSTASRQFIIL
jgi:hypothetical protein